MTAFNTSNPEYSEFIYKSRYAKWNEEEKRRETWDETVDRYISFFQNKPEVGPHTSPETFEEVRQAILNLEVMPSMRCLMTAGPALERDNVAGYNCAYVAVDDPKVFDEIMYVLMCGTGVGFSVERAAVDKLPTISETFHDSETTIKVADSRIGWATSYRELISMLYSGKVPNWDTSRVRPAGARLKTFGGRASGPQPLEDLFRFTIQIFRNAAGRKLSSIECHDLVCKVAQIVVVGGVRRSALISLSNLTDDRMRRAKVGNWWDEHGHRALANNSACYTQKPDMGIFMQEWTSLYESKSGERGIFNREASQRQAAYSGRRDAAFDFGTNPCSEIILRSKQFCNLSEVIVRPQDTYESLSRKIRIASILGTWQSTLTHFRYLSKQWVNNTMEERLLGVSMTGIMDHPVLNGGCLDRDGILDHIGFVDYADLPDVLTLLKQVAIDTNKEWADKLDIPQSTAITCVKPSGTVSQLCDTSSGIHARHSEFYVRTVRADKKDPLAMFMSASGYPVEDDVTNKSNYVFSFPVRSPVGAICRTYRSAIEQLELWKVYQTYWCEHKPSITVTVKEHEWMEVGAWVYANFDELSGVSFLPHSDHTYQQAPYQDCSEAEYLGLVERMPKNVDWSGFVELEDTTTASHEMACTGGSCELT